MGSAGGLLSSPGRKVGLRRQSTQKSNTNSTQHNIVVVKPALPQESTDTDVDILRLQVFMIFHSGVIKFEKYIRLVVDRHALSGRKQWQPVDMLQCCTSRFLKKIRIVIQ